MGLIISYKRFGPSSRNCNDRPAIVDAFLAGPLLHHRFAGHEIATVTAASKTASVGEFMRGICSSAEENLNRVPHLSLNNWRDGAAL